MKLKTAAMLATALCAASGCTTVTMTSYKGGYFGNVEQNGAEMKLSTGAVRGPTYSLPYTVLIIEGGHCVTVEAAKPKVEDAKKTETDKTNITITNSPTTAATSTAELTAGATAPPPAKAGGGSESKCDASSGTSPYGIKMTPLTMADASQTYQAAFDLSAFSSDTHKLKANEVGLLTSSNSESKDETREAIVAFGKLAGTMMGGTYKPADPLGVNLLELKGAKPSGVEQSAPPPLAPFKVACDMSTGLPNCVSTAAGGPANAVPVSGVSVQALFTKDLPDAKPAGTNAGLLQAGKTCFDNGACPGLLFRMRREMVIQVEVHSSDRTKYVDAGALFNVPVVDSLRTYSVTPIRQTFVQSKTDMTFDKGVLTGVEGVYPSTGGAIISTPLDLVAAVINGAKDFLTLRIEMVEKKKAFDDAVATEQDEKAAD